MFPAHAGMNRNGTDDKYLNANVPRTRGDEPTPSDAPPGAG